VIVVNIFLFFFFFFFIDILIILYICFLWRFFFFFMILFKGLFLPHQLLLNILLPFYLNLVSFKYTILFFFFLCCTIIYFLIGFSPYIFVVFNIRYPFGLIQEIWLALFLDLLEYLYSSPAFITLIVIVVSCLLFQRNFWQIIKYLLCRLKYNIIEIILFFITIPCLEKIIIY
jgi:hypothetical protein